MMPLQRCSPTVLRGLLVPSSRAVTVALLRPMATTPSPSGLSATSFIIPAVSSTQKLTSFPLRGYATTAVEKIIKVPPMAESIQEGTLASWHKAVGDFVSRDELIATIETDKVDIPVNSPESGTVLELFAKEGDTVNVGGNLFKVELGEGAPKPAASAPRPLPATPVSAPARPPPTSAAGPPPKTAAAPPPPPKASPAPVAASKPSFSTSAPGKPTLVSTDADVFPGALPMSRTERRVPMSRMRLRIAERLKESQNTAASLTTFNEIDMSRLIELRSRYKEAVLDRHGIKLGFMGAFIKAATYALREVPAVNARIEGDAIVYSEFVDVSVAVATPKGLVTPVVRNCESLSIVQIEQAMSKLAKKAKDNAITLEDMAGGTFTVSNGGVFGSLMGTPIINQPQSAILGMHATKERAVVVDGKVVVKPMMYVALTYDHRVIDGREAVTFLVKVKEAIEDPARILFDV